MAYTPPATAPQIPSFISTLINAYLEKGLTTLSVGLVANGVLQSDQTAQFVSIGVGAGAFFVSCLWAYFKSKLHVNQVIAAANAPPPAIPIPAK